MALCLLFILLLTATLAFLKDSIHKKAISLLLGLAFLLWLQGNILVWDYGPLDGRDINWSARIFNGLLDSTIWIAILIISYRILPYSSRITRQVSIAFVIIQVISLSITVVQSPKVSSSSNTLLQDEQSIYGFSPHRNVIILVLDSFQGDIFQEIIGESPRYRSILDGFTYYRNAVGGYPYTTAAVPLILTGLYYDNSTPLDDFVKDAFSMNSVPKILKDNGYQVDLIGGKRIYADEKIVSNSIHPIELLNQNIRRKEAALLIDQALFRYSPHFAKKYVYNNQTWLLNRLDWRGDGLLDFPASAHRDSIVLINRMVKMATAANDSETFKYIHVAIPHGPILVNERLEYEKMKSTRVNYKKQAKGSLQLVKIFLESLKESNIYDNSMILILADHGYGLKIEMKGTAYQDNSQIGWPLIERIKAKAIPLFLVKPLEARGELKISDAPVAHCDVAKTILTELGLETEVPGVSVFEIKENDARTRRYMDHEWGKEANLDSHMPPMREYVVSGLSWLNDSWRPTHILYTKEGVRDSSLGVYDYGSTIKFGRSGNSLVYQGWGWSHPEEDYTWTDKKSASLIMPITKPRSDVELKVRLRPLILAEKVDRQRVTVEANRKKLGRWILTGDAIREQTFIIPKSSLTRGSLGLVFRLPDAVSPSAMGVGDDARTLGIQMHSITLSETGEMPRRENRN